MSLDLAFFLGIALVGALFLFVSFILGEVGDFFDGVGDAIGETLDFGDADADAGDGGDGHDGPTPFSLRNLMAFMTAYGASGIITSSYGWSTLASSLFALLPGIAMAAVAYQGMKMLYSQQASSVVEVAGLLGKSAVVDVTIPGTGVGKVTVSTAEGQTSFIARSAGTDAIAAGETVVVTGNVGGELVVARANNPA